MKLNRILILALITITCIQASPRHRHHPYSNPYRSNHYYGSMYASRYSPYYSPYYTPYRYYRYYSPVIVTTQSTTTYPTNLVLLTANDAAKDIVSLNDLASRGMITEKDFTRAKKTLLNRIGMTVNPDALGPTTAEIIDQIEILYGMRSGQLLTEKEYRNQKNKLLALI
ncbi:MAG: hypothetical protein L3J79_01165 [Candidatus Marinimicrobia bacterium]|nr:hypothetical protein [Candidatus Neomarinimicrobiota bacterium]